MVVINFSQDGLRNRRVTPQVASRSSDAALAEVARRQVGACAKGACGPTTFWNRPKSAFNAAYNAILTCKTPAKRLAASALMNTNSPVKGDVSTESGASVESRLTSGCGPIGV